MIEKTIHDPFGKGGKLLISMLGKNANLDSPAESPIRTLNQTHGDKVWYVKGNSKKKNIPHSEYPIWESNPPDGDGLYSFSSEDWLQVRTADCVPVFFALRQEPCFGVIHSGWKGTHLEITTKALLALKKSKKFSLKEVYLLLGPCIGKSDFQIQEDVAKHFLHYSSSVWEKTENGYLLDLQLAILESLERTFPKEFSSWEIDREIESTKNSLNWYSHRSGETGRNLHRIRWSRD